MLAVGDIASDAAARFGYVSPAVREAVVMCYARYAMLAVCMPQSCLAVCLCWLYLLLGCIRFGCMCMLQYATFMFGRT
jgi:hypothetical protein